MMIKCDACWLRLYGLFLIVAGVAGWLSNPEKAQTALISGGTFGALTLILGQLAAGGRRWAFWTFTAVVSLLAVVFIIRSTITWSAYLGGNADKLFAAVLISLMFLASVSVLPIAVRGARAKASAAA